MRPRHRTARGRVGRWPTGLYYGWIIAAVLGATTAVSYGILYYGFSVFVVPMGEDLGWSRSQVTGAFSVALLVGGIAGIPVGRWVDRHGARGVMTGGSVLAAAGLLLWSRTTTLPGFYGTFLLVGLAMPGVFYEPAFTVMANWFARSRARALAVLTVLGGCASLVFLPLITHLVESMGWRQALVWLAILLGAITIPPHALLIRRRPEDLGLRVDGDLDRPQKRPPTQHETGEIASREALRSRSFFLVAAAFGASALVSTGVAVHFIPLLLERGHSLAQAGLAMGLVGFMALPGRLALVPLSDRWSMGSVGVAIFGIQAMGLGLLAITPSPAGVWLFVALFGLGQGAVTPVRAGMQAELYGRASYGAIGGALGLVVALARAGAPIGVSSLHVVGGGYEGVLWALLVVVGGSALAVRAAGSHATHPVSSRMASPKRPTAAGASSGRTAANPSTRPGRGSGPSA